MTLADELRILVKKIEAGQIYSTDAIVERAEVLEAAYRDDHAALTRANIPVKEPACSVVLTDSGWYEWVLPGKTCERGFVTWREAHEAARVVLAEDPRDRYKGKVKGAVLHLNALIKALDGSKGHTEVVATMRRLVRFLEEE